MAKHPYLGEGLLAPGVIRLFGREFEGLALVKEDPDLISNDPFALRAQIDTLMGAIANLRKDMAKQQSEAQGAGEATKKVDESDPAEEQDGKARLARIYGFSYLGHYYKIASPPVLRVYGQGFPVNPGWLPENKMDILGVEFKHSDFVEGIRMWPVDHLDAIVRIDITIGWVRELLLDQEMSSETNVTDGSNGSRSDIVGRDSGLVGRDSGLVGRDSGLVGRDSGFVGRSRAR